MEVLVPSVLNDTSINEHTKTWKIMNGTYINAHTIPNTLGSTHTKS